MENSTEKTLYRSHTDKIIFGVCGGLAKYFDKDAGFFRFLAAVIVLFLPFGLFAYLFFAIFVPMEPEDTESEKTADVEADKLKEFEGETIKEE